MSEYNQNNLSPFKKIFYKKEELKYPISKFKYCHAEEEDDLAEIELVVDNPVVLDEPCFNPQEEWTLLWGYIGGDTNTQKVYVEDVMPVLGKDGITITIKLHDKAAMLKKITSKRVYKNSTVPGVAQTIGKEKGLKVIIEKPKDLGPNATLSDYIRAGKEKELKNLPQPVTDPRAFQIAIKKSLLYQKFYNDPSEQVEVSDGVFKNKYDAYPAFEKLLGKDPTISKAVEEGRLDPKDVRLFVWLQKNFKNQGDTAQANRTHTQLLLDMCNGEPGGPYLVTGHDDELKIHKRNFNQPPFRSYVYLNGGSELIEFKPESQNKSKAAGATATSFSGWDKKKKQAFSGVATPQEKLAGFETLLGGGITNETPYIIPQAPINADGTQSALPLFRITSNKSSLNGPSFEAISTNRVVQAVDNARVRPISVMVRNDVLENKQNPTGDPDEAAAGAANDLAQDNQEQNPGTLNVIGNPKLLSGKIVTILNAGKKYSGNYYVTKAVHDLTSPNAYLTVCEISRNTVGNTGKKGATQRFMKGASKIINHQMGSRAFNNTRRRVRSH